MKKTLVLIGLVAICIVGTIAIFSFVGVRQETSASDTSVHECDSCGARKKDLTRMRQTLSASSAKQD